MDAFSGRLLPGEQTVWSGAPRPGLHFSARDAFLIPFSILWLGFVIFWTGAVVLSGAPISFAAFGLVFLVFGLFISVGRFIIDASVRKSTRYCLTDQRVLILRRWPSTNFLAVELSRIPQIDLAEHRDGTGTIRLGQPANLFAVGANPVSMWVPSLDPTPQLIRISEPRSVLEKLQLASRHTD